MPLRNLSLKSCRNVADLEGLRGLPLTRLDLHFCDQLTSLEPLRGCPLNHLIATHCDRLTSIEPLRGMRLHSLSLGWCREIDDLSPLADMPLEDLKINNLPRVTDFSVLPGMPLHTLNLSETQFANLKLLDGIPLQSLTMFRCEKLTSLEGIERLPELSRLEIGFCPVGDMSPLRALPLTHLNISNNKRLKSLEFLRGMNQLTTLAMINLPAVDDLTPLDGLELESLSLTASTIKRGWDVVEKMKTLKTVTPTRGLPLERDEFFRRLKRGDYKR
jgi:hypothetical protein